MSTPAATQSRSQALEADRRKYVSASVATAPIFVDHAHGVRITDVDGREYIDFVGGIGTLNGGHTPTEVVRAIHEQADRYLHQMYSIVQYEPYIEVCKRLTACHPGAGPYKALLLNSGAEAVENAVKIARVATGRAGIVCFDQAFHGRTLLGLTLTSKANPYKKDFGPYAPEVYRAAGPYPYRGISSDDAIASIEKLFKSQIDASQIAAIIYEPVQGEGGFLPSPPDFLPRLQDLCRAHGILLICDEVQSGMCRTGLPSATAHFEGVEPDLITWGKSMGGGLPLSGVTGRAELLDAVQVGGLGGTYCGNPLSCAAAIVALDQVLDPAFQEQSQAFGERLRVKLDALAANSERVGEVRGLGPMLALELVTDRETKTPAAELTGRVVGLARERGLLVMAAGLYSNVIRVLVPLVATDDEVDEGLAILTGALADAA